MSIDAWRAIVRLGSARRPSPPAAPHPTLARAFASLDWSQGERALLDAAALVAAARAAGAEALQGAQRSQPCEIIVEPCVSETAAHALRRLLAGEEARCLEEWLAAAAELGLVPRPRDLPALLERARSDAALAPAVCAVLGARGRWLAQRYPAWAEAIGGTDEALDFETGTAEQRLRWLQLQQERDPARAAEALAAVWSAESGDQRERMLALVASKPHPALLELLETRALTDRRGATRQLARRALLRLEASPYRARMAERAKALLRLEKAPVARLVLELPPRFESEWARDGLESKPPSGVGERAHWACQILSAVPIAHWCQHFGLSPSELHAANIDAESRELIAQAWLESLLALPQPVEAAAFARAGMLEGDWPKRAPQRVEFASAWLRELPMEVASEIVERPLMRALEDPLFLQLLGTGRLRAAPRDRQMLRRAIDALIEAVPPRLDAALCAALGRWIPRSAIDEIHAHLLARTTIPSVGEALLRTLEFRRDFLRALGALPTT